MSEIVELKEYMQDIEQKLDKANDRGIRTETKLDNVLQWKDHHEAQDMLRFDKVESKQEAVKAELFNEIDDLKDDINQLKLELVGSLNTIRKENAESHQATADAINANATRVAWIMGIGIGLSFAVTFASKYLFVAA